MIDSIPLPYSVGSFFGSIETAKTNLSVKLMQVTNNSSKLVFHKFIQISYNWKSHISSQIKSNLFLGFRREE